MKLNIKSQRIGMVVCHNVHWVCTILLIRISSYKISREASEWRPCSSNFLGSEYITLFNSTYQAIRSDAFIFLN